MSVGRREGGNRKNGRLVHHSYKHHKRCLNLQFGITLQTTHELTMHYTSKNPKYFQVQSLTLSIIFDVSSISNFVIVSEYTYLKVQVITAFSFQKWA